MKLLTHLSCYFFLEVKILASRYVECLPWLKQYIGHIDMDTHESIAHLVGIACSTLYASSSSILIQEFFSKFKVSNKGRFVNL